MDLDVILSRPYSETEMQKKISAEVNRLILEDFNGLISLLYRLDIHEGKLRKTLSGNNADAGDIIATMILERQKQKQEAKKLFKSGDCDEERW